MTAWRLVLLPRQTCRKTTLRVSIIIFVFDGLRYSLMRKGEGVKAYAFRYPTVFEVQVRLSST